MTTPLANGRNGQRLARKAALAGFIAPTLLLAGCVLNEGSLDAAVYFDNTTDQTLYLRRRDQLDMKDHYWTISPRRTTQIQLLSRGSCNDLWLIATEKDSKNPTIVKDPGRICWHDTVTIP